MGNETFYGDGLKLIFRQQKVDFQMAAKSPVFTHWLKIISKHALKRLVY